MKSFVWSLSLSGLALAASIGSAAELKLASIFSDHMVLQRDRPVAVWGTCAPNETVEIEFKGQKKSAQAGADGKWMLHLEALEADAKSAELKAATKSAPHQAIKLTDILVGDVWLAAGQSNMEWEMGWKSDSKEDIPNTDHPGLRLIQIPLLANLAPQDSIHAQWERSTPQSAGSFSAVGYYFGLKLHQDVGVPIGVIQSAWGGTRIEPWIDPTGFLAIAGLQEFGQSVVSQLPGRPEYRAAHEAHFASIEHWLAEARTAVQSGQAPPAQPVQPPSFHTDSSTPTALYNAMIHPLVPFTLKGAIWYQGESNHTDGFSYVDKTAALLHSWRTAFKNPELPFYYVQIAPWQYGDEAPEILPQFWRAQQECLKLPHTGMAVITDIADLQDIHPANKKEVARRLALWPLVKDYGHQDLDPSGPLYKSYKIVGSTIQVEFEHTHGGLTTRDGQPPSHFEIAGADGTFAAAEAQIVGSSVILRSAQIDQPKQARFAWSKLAMPNLMNGDKLTAAAFHTHWPSDSDLSENFAKNATFESSDPNIWGWNVGLTDGVWGNAAPECFATGVSDAFPKHVTLDLKKSIEINQVHYGVPNVGSTKTVSVSISQDGKEFTEVATHAFSLNKAERAVATFPNTPARYVRLSFKDFHDAEIDGYSKMFGFLSEVEVYCRSR